MEQQKGYARKGRNLVNGWLSRIDAEIFCLVTCYQNGNRIEGGVAEIGLHHGKSFIPLCLSLRNGEKAYGIDLFEEQHANLDNSGRGVRERVERNLAQFGIDGRSVVLDQRDSQSVTATEILDAVGPVRFFSVDGGHWFDVVVNDLKLAESCLAPHGVVAIDDFLRCEWPDVSAAFFHWFENKEAPLVPFAIGYNKIYLCHQDSFEDYTGAVQNSDFLRLFLVKRYKFLGRNIPIFHRNYFPETRLPKRLRGILMYNFPDFYAYLIRTKRSIFHSGHQTKLAGLD